MHLVGKFLLFISSLVITSSLAQSPTNTDVASGNNAERIVATVNGQAITLAELNHAAGASVDGIEDPKARSLMLSQVLNELISQNLLEQEFKKNNLNLEDNNKWQIDFAIKQSVANFYLNSQLNKLPKFDQKLLNQFILDNPQFSVKRKAYHYNQIIIDPSSPSTLPELRKLIDNGASLEGLLGWLKQNEVAYMHSNLWRSSEQIPESVSLLLKNDILPFKINNLRL